MAEQHLTDAQLSAYVMGKASTAEAAATELHLGACGECRRRLTQQLRPPTEDDEALDSRPPPSLELPETRELREIPSQVSMVSIPHTLEAEDRPSVTSINAPTRPRSAPVRRSSRGRWVAAVVLGGMAALIVVAVYTAAIRPHARSITQTRRAEETLRPVFQSLRLPDLQHTSLAGATPYVPGADTEVEARLTDARNALERAVSADGGNAEARSMLALVLLMQGETRSARMQYQEVEALLGSSSELKLGMGVLDYMAGVVAEDPKDQTYSFEQAEARFSTIRLGDPGYPESVYNRCIVAAALGEDEQAARLRDVYSELQPGSPGVAWLTERLGSP